MGFWGQAYEFKIVKVGLGSNDTSHGQNGTPQVAYKCKCSHASFAHHTTHVPLSLHLVGSYRSGATCSSSHVRGIGGIFDFVLWYLWLLMIGHLVWLGFLGFWIWLRPNSVKKEGRNSEATRPPLTCVDFSAIEFDQCWPRVKRSLLTLIFLEKVCPIRLHFWALRLRHFEEFDCCWQHVWLQNKVVHFLSPLTKFDQSFRSCFDWSLTSKRGCTGWALTKLNWSKGKRLCLY